MDAGLPRTTADNYSWAVLNGIVDHVINARRWRVTGRAGGALAPCQAAVP